VRLGQGDGAGDDHSRLHCNRHSDHRDHFTHASRQSQDELKIAGPIRSRAVRHFYASVFAVSHARD
jgi:hypothetical protein